LNGISEVLLGLSWELVKDAAVDLDASCVLFNAKGQFIESVYFGNLKSSNGAIVHTGDNRSGAAEGHGEEIVVNVKQIPAEVRALVFCVSSYSGERFTDVKSATVTIYNTSTKREAQICSFKLSQIQQQTAVIMGKMFRNDSEWVWHSMGTGLDGRSFGDLLPAMQTSLKDIIPGVVVAPKPDVLVLAKGEAVSLGSAGRDQCMRLRQVEFGLGWDMIGKEAVDLDASCVMFDSKNNCVDAVFFQKLQSDDGAVKHGGDNLTGAGEGDDEKILVDLSRVRPEVETLYLVVTSYQGHKFSKIKNAYVRVLPKGKPQELIRFQLSGKGGAQHTAMIMCKIYRRKTTSEAESDWFLKALGYGTNGSMYQDLLPDLRKELANRLKLSGDGFKYVPVMGKGGAITQHGKSPLPMWSIVLILAIFVYLVFLGSRNPTPDVTHSAPTRNR